MCPGIGRPRMQTQVFVEPSLWNSNSWQTKHSMPAPQRNSEYPWSWLLHGVGRPSTKKLRKGTFECGYILDLEQMGKTIIVSPNPLSLKLVGLPLLSSDSRPERRRGKTHKRTRKHLSPLLLVRQPSRSNGFPSTCKKWIRPEDLTEEP